MLMEKPYTEVLLDLKDKSEADIEEWCAKFEEHKPDSINVLLCSDLPLSDVRKVLDKYFDSTVDFRWIVG